MADARVYLDSGATAPISDRARAALEEALDARYGNAMSGHAFGRDARERVERARGQVAALLGASPAQVVFTSGGTEALNAALKGLAFARSDARRDVLLVGATEHHAVSDSARFLDRFGFATRAIGVDAAGRVDPAAVETALRERAGRALLVAVQHANNEVGTIHDVAAIARACRAAGTPFVCDAVQSAGKVPVRFDAWGVDLLAVSAHKFRGPKGVGALLVRDGAALEPLLHGAPQEDGRRAGTHDVPGIAAMGEAAEEAAERLAADAARESALRDVLAARCLEIEGAAWNGAGADLLPTTFNVSFEGVLARELLAALDRRGIAAAAGAACRSGVDLPSATLLAMGAAPDRALGGVRFTLGPGTRPEDVERAAAAVRESVREIRAAKTDR